MYMLQGADSVRDTNRITMITMSLEHIGWRRRLVGSRYSGQCYDIQFLTSASYIERGAPDGTGNYQQSLCLQRVDPRRMAMRLQGTKWNYCSPRNPSPMAGNYHEDKHLAVSEGVGHDAAQVSFPQRGSAYVVWRARGEHAAAAPVRGPRYTNPVIQ